LFDPAWWRYWRLMIRAYQVDDAYKLDLAAYQLILAQVANGSLSDESFGKVQDKALQAFAGLTNRLNPSAVSDMAAFRQAEHDELKRIYYEIYGDPNDPEVQRREAVARAQYELEQAQYAAVQQREYDLQRRLEEQARRRHRQGR
jgi:hypothetical protein